MYCSSAFALNNIIFYSECSNCSLCSKIKSPKKDVVLGPRLQIDHPQSKKNLQFVISVFL